MWIGPIYFLFQSGEPRQLPQNTDEIEIPYVEFEPNASKIWKFDIFEMISVGNNLEHRMRSWKFLNLTFHDFLKQAVL